MAKLWQKGDLKNSDLTKRVEKFTVGNDRNLDLLLAKQDILGTMAHIKMLNKVNLLTTKELQTVIPALRTILKDVEAGKFSLAKDSEDIHSEIEFRLVKSLGEVGKKIHTGRSRNDQVLLDIKLFTREKMEQIVIETKKVFDQLISLSNKHQNKLLPGYTHLQLAMPSSFGLWFGAYAESLADDMEVLYAAFKLANKNPLGSGAGYGSSFQLDRNITTTLLGFEDMNYNVVYAQMNRGKMERVVTQALAGIAATLSKFAMDATLYLNQNFGFISFPETLTTGSSIMPHKKNPDVLELIRAKCNKLQNLPLQIQTITNNLPSGYHRDTQIIKEDYLLSFDTLLDCLGMTTLMLQHIKIKDNILNGEQYKYLFTVDSINDLIHHQNMSFRDAYVTIGKEVESGNYKRPAALTHTLQGSMGNLCNDKIAENMKNAIAQFPFKKIHTSLQKLIK